ncbi:MAG: DM13 domain-containing protein, partial [Anaerolinea sp.]|nr:DM13 domain-containing protein [Anaerolinea sp.]
LTNPVVMATGVFQRIDAVRWAQGDATIYQGTDGGRVLRFDNFSMANAPDMRVFLSASTNPVTPEDMRLQGIEVDLGALQGTSGPQNYTISDAVELANYRSVVLYSPSLDMIYAFAPLFVRM